LVGVAAISRNRARSNRATGAADGDRLRGGIQQPRARAGASGDLRALDQGRRRLSRRSVRRRPRRARRRLWPDAAPVHRSVPAGGHLAACMVATDWKTLAPEAPPDLVPAGYSISGVFDLAPLVNVSMNQDLKLDADGARRVSPLTWPGAGGRTFDAVAGGLES